MKRAAFALSVLGLAVAALTLGTGAAPATNSFSRLVHSLPTGDGGLRILTVSPGRWTVSESVTIPSNVAVVFQPGALLVQSGYSSIDFRGPVQAGPVRIFEGFAASYITFAGPVVILPEWWGPAGEAQARAAETGSQLAEIHQGPVQARAFNFGTDAGTISLTARGAFNLSTSAWLKTHDVSKDGGFHTFADVVWHPSSSLFVAVGTGIATSPDGVTWTHRNRPSETGTQVFTRVISVGTRLVAMRVCQSGCAYEGSEWMARSTDGGLTWTAISAPVPQTDYAPTTRFLDVAASSSRIVVLGETPHNYPRAWVSTDYGGTWAETMPGYGNLDAALYIETVMRAIAYGNGRFVAVGGSIVNPTYSPPQVSYSTDGFTWTTINLSSGYGYLTAIGWNGTVFGAVGRQKDGLGYSLQPGLHYSSDGITWTHSKPTGPLLDFLYPLTSSVCGWIAINYGSSTLWTNDANTWLMHQDRSTSSSDPLTPYALRYACNPASGVVVRVGQEYNGVPHIAVSSLW